MNRARLVLLVFLAALGTALLGWWCVVLVGALRGLAPAAGRPALEAAASAAIGWGALLAWTAAEGPVWLLAGEVGATIGIPGWALLAVPLVFAALLAACATELVRAARRA